MSGESPPNTDKAVCAIRTMDMELTNAVRNLERYVMEYSSHMFQKQHRDGKHKRKFSLKGSYKVGRGSTQPGNIQHIGKKPHFRKHNFKNTAVNLQSVHKQKGINEYQKRAYVLAKCVIELLDPVFAKGETYLVNFSHMDSRLQHVKKHVDGDDITYQYILSFGDYQGDVKLFVYDALGYFRQSFNCKGRILKVDGRRPHRVRKTPDFEGNRFAVIWYKSYDERITAPTPILEDPYFVYPRKTLQ